MQIPDWQEEKQAPLNHYQEQGAPSSSASVGTLVDALREIADMDEVVSIERADPEGTPEREGALPPAQDAAVIPPPASSPGTDNPLAARPPGQEEEPLQASVALAPAVHNPAGGSDDTAAGSSGLSAKGTS